MFLWKDAFTTGFDAKHFYGGILKKWIKEANRVGATANTGDEQIGQAFFLLEDLSARLIADHALKIANHNRIRMSAIGSAQDVMGRTDIGDPVAHGFVDGLLECLLTGSHGDDI